MSYKPAQSGVPNGIVYFGNAASDNVFEAESAFVYNPSTNTLNVDNVSVDVDASVGGNLSVTGSGSFDGDVTILGDLNVSGVVNQINLQELLIEDNKIVLNSNYNTNDTEPTADAAIIVNRGPNGSTVKDVEVRWDENYNHWEFTNDGTNYHPFVIEGSGLKHRFGDTNSDHPILDLDLDDLPVVTSAEDNDYIAIADFSDGNATRKITRSNLLTGLGAGTVTSIDVNGGSGISIPEVDPVTSTGVFTVNIKTDNSTIEVDSVTNSLRLKASGIGFTHLSDALVITSSETFSDVDNALMTAAAIADKIESYGYSTSTGTITEVIGGSGLSPDAGVTSGSITLDIKTDGSTVGINGSDQVYVKDSGINTTQLADGAVTEVKVTRTITEVSTSSTASNDVTLVNTAGSDKTITLPVATNGRVVVIKKKDSAAGNVVVVGATHDSVTDTIDGASSKRLYYVNESMTCIAKNTGTSTEQQAWYII